MILRHYVLASLLWGLALCLSSRVDAQSFDCKKASTLIENAICNDAAVGAVDRELADAFRRLLRTHPDWKGKLLLAERQWLRYRDRQCSGFAADLGKMDGCLREQYARRLAIIESSDPLADPIAKIAAPGSVAHALALDYRARIRAALKGEALPRIPRAAIAGSNVPRAPASVDEIFDQCAALDEGLVRRLPEYAALRINFTRLASEMANSPAYRQSAERLEFTQCSWLRVVATQCLEPTTYYGANKSPIERLAQDIPVGGLYEAAEDDCMRGLIQKRSSDLDKLAAVSPAQLAREILRRIPPVTFFGIYVAAPPRACIAGDPGYWALNPYFDDWVDCSETPKVLVVGTTADDTLSGVSIWVGTPMYEGDEDVFSGTATYQQDRKLLASSTKNLCPLELNARPAGMAVRFRKSTECRMTGAGHRFSGSPVDFHLVLVKAPTPDDPLERTVQVEDFVNGSRPARAWILNGRDVTVAWILGLNRSVQTSSDCYDLPAYDHLVQFFANYKTAVIMGNVNEVAALTAFPLQINRAATKFVKNSAELRRQFMTVFPRPLVGVLRDVDPHFVYCQRGHVMIAAGRLWAKPERGALRVYFVDSHAHPLGKPKPLRIN